MTARDLPGLPETDLSQLVVESPAGGAPEEAVSEGEWERAWLVEIEQRVALEPDDALGADHELPAVRQRLLNLFR
jgi:hypothetical protein